MNSNWSMFEASSNFDFDARGVPPPKRSKLPGKQFTIIPVNTGTSVMGMKFDCGVIIAADTLISYGSLKRHHNVERVLKINNEIIIGGGGDFSDFQWLKGRIDQLIMKDQMHDDGFAMTPKGLLTWITRIVYDARSRMEPLQVNVVVGGMQDGKPYLGRIDMRGSPYEDDVVATGFGIHMALPLMREAIDSGKGLTWAKASQLVRKCMEILYYRDTRSTYKYTVGVCTANDCRVQGPFEVKQNWELAAFMNGY